MAPTATWTAPRDWTAGETLSAANFDTYLSSNLLWLKTPPTDDVQLGADITTTSTSFVDATGLSITLASMTGGRALIGFSGVGSNNTAGQAVALTFTVDATAIGPATHGVARGNSSTGGNVINLSSTWLTITALSAGSHTFTVQWKVSANTGTLYQDSSFWVREV